MFKLEFGDCLEVMAKLPANSVDMVLCDLPYGTTRCSWDSVLDLPRLWAHYRRVVKPNGAILLFAQTPFDKVLGASNLDDLRYELIWEKPNATGFLNAKRAPLKAHENILVFYRALPTYTPEKSTGHPMKTTGSRKCKNLSPVYGAQSETQPYNSTERYPRSVLKYSSEKQRGGVHPTQKPVDLLRYLIRLYSLPGDVILDNTMGSGSTGVAALAEGRGFIGIEKEAEWFEVAMWRLEQQLMAAA